MAFLTSVSIDFGSSKGYCLGHPAMSLEKPVSVYPQVSLLKLQNKIWTESLVKAMAGETMS